jgi:hypothetical protein
MDKELALSDIREIQIFKRIFYRKVSFVGHFRLLPLQGRPVSRRALGRVPWLITDYDFVTARNLQPQHTDRFFDFVPAISSDACLRAMVGRFEPVAAVVEATTSGRTDFREDEALEQDVADMFESGPAALRPVPTPRQPGDIPPPVVLPRVDCPIGLPWARDDHSVRVA